MSEEIPESIEVLGSYREDGLEHSETTKAHSLVLNENLNIDADAFAKRMECLIQDVGLPPKRARFKALDELTDLTRVEMADLFDVAKGTMDATAVATEEGVQERSIGHYALFDQPMNFLAMAEFEAEGVADYYERIYFYEQCYARAHKDIRNADELPEFTVVKETVAPHDIFGYSVSDIDINHYAHEGLVVGALYEFSSFETVERAEEMRDLLEYVFDVEVENDPGDQLMLY